MLRALVSAGATGAAAPVNFGQWVHAPVNFGADTSFRLFCLIFPANHQILHPSIEISNQSTAKEEKKFAKANTFSG